MEKRQRERLRRQKQQDKEQRRVSRIAQRRTEREKGGNGEASEESVSGEQPGETHKPS